MPKKMMSRAIILAYKYKILIPETDYQKIDNHKTTSQSDPSTSSESSLNSQTSGLKPINWKERKIRDRVQDRNDGEDQNGGGN